MSSIRRSEEKAPWWQTGVFYEVLLPSFQDSDGDGWGDLNGLVQRLDYLADLGVDALWLTPFYRTSFYDFGYDIIDHTQVEPRFGTLEDFDRLLAAAHERELRVVIDYVPNHTSCRNAWFEASRSSRDNPKRDWYLWADPAHAGGPPNNWVNRFGKSAWTLDEASGQYYFGTFTSEQPDLNWRNPQVRQAQFDLLRFWLERGVDGVRVDALAHLIKDRQLRNNPPNPGYSEQEEPMNILFQAYSQNQPELLELLGQLRAVIDEYPDRVLVGEAYQAPEQLAAYQRAGVHLLLNTSVLQMPFEARQIRFMLDYLEGTAPINAWPSLCSGNHDIARLAQRVGPSNLRLAALLQLTVRGTPTLYYGDELGLQRIEVPKEKIQDPSGHLDPRYCRDCFRVPMPWNQQMHAGFSSAVPWLPLDQVNQALNVEAQRTERGSLLNFYRLLLHTRRGEADLQNGLYAPLDTSAPILAFRRGAPADGLLIALNIGDDETTLEIPGMQGEIFLSTTGERAPTFQARLLLGPREGIIARLQ